MSILANLFTNAEAISEWAKSLDFELAEAAEYEIVEVKKNGYIVLQRPQEDFGKEGKVDEIKFFRIVEEAARVLYAVATGEVHLSYVAPRFTPTPTSTPPPQGTFIVNSTADAVDANPGDGACDDGAGNCTLRAAIMEANAVPGIATITLPSGTYRLSIQATGGDAATTVNLAITDDLIIEGAVEATTIVDGGGVQILSEITVELSGLTVRNATSSGIFNAGTLTMKHVTITGNQGGGIYNRGVLEITDSAISDNMRNGSGGGIFNVGTITMNNVTVSGNSGNGGGGIYNSSGLMVINGSTISDNDAGGGVGGGIFNSKRGKLILTDTSGSGNKASYAAGGIGNSGILESTNSNITGDVTDPIR